MKYINGGETETKEYGCMYDHNDEYDRYDHAEELIGLTGYVWLMEQGKHKEHTKHPAMLWFTGSYPENITFQKGELYFPEADMTYSEIMKDTEYNIEDFEPTDTEGRCMEGPVLYKGTEYKVYMSDYAEETVLMDWDERIAAEIAKEIAERRK